MSASLSPGPRRRGGRRLLVLGVLLAAACESPRHATSGARDVPSAASEESAAGDGAEIEARPGETPGDPEAAATRVERDLPEGWDEAPPAAFESWLAELEAEDGPLAWSPAARRELVVALAREDRAAVHAAVLLAHAPDAASTDALLGRLEGRHVAAARALDAGDVVAAAALDSVPVTAEQLARMCALVRGADPHPDLEVRVEIARAALARGADEVIPFLLRVLRALTPAEAQDPPDWTRITTLAWAKSRAAEALAARAGEAASQFRPDASWEDQMREAARLEALLSDARR